MFAFKGHQLRGVKIDSEPWFVAADACRILDLKSHATSGAFTRHLAKLDADERKLLRRDGIQLNLTQVIEIHPGSPVQVPHRDQDMWQGPKGDMEYLVNIMWPTTPFTRENGATIVWPHSHRAQDEIILPEDDALDAEMSPGSALIFLGSTLHGGGRNLSNDIRRGVIISYSLGWLKPYENQWLAYLPSVPRTAKPIASHLDPGVFVCFTPIRNGCSRRKRWKGRERRAGMRPGIVSLPG
jgi:ectoine hydroxylase-related dioxygenase (phytanoyl-CoA dioxygenase family)